MRGPLVLTPFGNEDVNKKKMRGERVYADRRNDELDVNLIERKRRGERVYAERLTDEVKGKQMQTCRQNCTTNKTRYPLERNEIRQRAKK